MTMVKDDSEMVSDANHGKYWWNMMKVRWLSYCLKSLKNCHKQFRQWFRPPPLFRQCPNKYVFSWHGAPLICPGLKQNFLSWLHFSMESGYIHPSNFYLSIQESVFKPRNPFFLTSLPHIFVIYIYSKPNLSYCKYHNFHLYSWFPKSVDLFHN